MATMIPNDVEEFHSEGERAFYKFLQSVGKPDSRYISWYLPDIKDKELDFLFQEVLAVIPEHVDARRDGGELFGLFRGRGRGSPSGLREVF